MKTLQLSIIIGMGIAMIVIVNSNLSFAQEGGIYFCCGPTLHIPDSPLKQFKSGISLDDITCNDGFFLAISNEKSPLCLKAGTISKLATRGFFYGINANKNEINYTTVLIPPGSENQNSNKTYSPNIVMVTIGVNNTVRWVNQADVGNSVASDTPVEQGGKMFSSDFIGPGQSYEFTFTNPGTYHYHGAPHPWQLGTVIVSQISENTTRLNPVIDVISISGTGSPPNPGGPEIQLTLMNIGMKPVTNLKATLDLNNNYTFNFKDVTESNPLAPGHSASDTEILIGAGFRSELAYPITISGIANDIPFNFTESVHIPYTNENNPVQNSSSPILPLQSKEITALENYTGTVTLGNQIYYFDTPNYTAAAYTNPVQVSFHDVLFTLFPSRFAGGLPADGCGGKYYWANAEFPDGIRELLQIFVDSQPCNSHSTPIYFSTHTIPQAGLTFYDGKMKMLVSVETQVGKDIVLEKLSSDAKPFPICNTNPTKEKLVREKQKILEDALTAEEAKYGGFENRTQNLPWSGIGYDCVDNALEVNILPQYFSVDLLPKYFEKIRSIVGNLIDIALSPRGYATPV